MSYSLVMDPLSDVLSVARASAAIFSRARCRGDAWGVETRGASGGIFHAILRGQAYIRVADDKAVYLGPGDLVLLPHGSPHTLASEPDVPGDWIGGLPTEPTDDGLRCVVAGEGELRAEILCGSLTLEPDASTFLSPLLPSLIRVGAGGALAGWLDATLKQLAGEFADVRPGAGVLSARLAELLVVQALRRWGAETPSGGWLAALWEPGLARALGGVHESPANDWTADSMARRAGMSRSSFYESFTSSVGESPAVYVRRWRMTLARGWLRKGISVGEIAERTGYGSDQAFSRAFKRTVGQSPAHWRRAAREAGNNP